jgi:hypothetical protein
MTHLIENAHRRPVLIANNSAFEILKLPWPPVAQPILAVRLSARPLPRAAGQDRAESRNRMKQIARATVCPFALMARSAVLDFAERSRRKKIFCGDRRSVELRALCNDSPRTPPGPEGSNGNGSASCAAEYPKFLSSQLESVWAHGKTG